MTAVLKRRDPQLKCVVWLGGVCLAVLIFCSWLATLQRSGDLIGVWAATMRPRESVRAELIRLQEKQGLSLVSLYDDRIRRVDFGKRSVVDARWILNEGTVRQGAISPDGTGIAFDVCLHPVPVNPFPSVPQCPQTYLGTIRTDGRDFREYSNLTFPSGTCWSYDNSKLVLAASNHLQILDLKTGISQTVDDLNAFATAQCWSPDGKQMAYTVNKSRGIQTIRLYDLANNRSRELADGGRATWSPDGKWIAFLYCSPSLAECTYYAIRPSGDGKRMLFKVIAGQTALAWSPDSHLVAYVSPPPGLFPEETGRLRVRRLDDSSETWVANLGNQDWIEFQWVNLPKFLTH